MNIDNFKQNTTDNKYNHLDLARHNSKYTRKLKRLTTYTKNKSNLQIKYYNELLDALIETGLYTEIFNKMINDKENELTEDDLEILKEFNFCNPEELENLYK